MSLGVIVEGPSDRKPIRTLLEKLGRTVSGVRVVRQGDMLNVPKMATYIDLLAQPRHRFDRIFIFRDSEGVDPNDTYEATREAERSLSSMFSRPEIRYVIVDHSIEGWLASDHDAVRQVLGGKREISRLNNADVHQRPADLLARVFRANRRSFDKNVHNQQIAELADTSVIAQKSPTFTRLVDLLRG